MGCGSSSLKGEDVHDLSEMPRSNPTSNPNPSSDLQPSRQHAVINDPRHGQGQREQPTASHGRIDNPPTLQVTDHSDSVDDTNNPDVSKARSGSSLGSSASRFRSKLSAGSFSMSSPAPRKKQQELTEEDLLKYTGMTGAQLKTWGDQNVYRRQEVGGAGGAMGATWASQGAMGGM